MTAGEPISGQGPDHLLTQLGMRVIRDIEGGPFVEVDVRPEVANPHGGLHGGLMAAVVECGAASIVVAAGGSENIVAGDMTLRFLRPVRVGPARVSGRVLHLGRRSIVVQVDVTDEGDGAHLAASATVGYTRLDAYDEKEETGTTDG